MRRLIRRPTLRVLNICFPPIWSPRRYLALAAGAFVSIAWSSSASSADTSPISTRSSDPELDEGCAFEELISFHGGMGGPQTRAFILHPVGLPVPDEPIVGAAHVHEVLAGWRRTLQSEPHSVGTRSHADRIMRPGTVPWTILGSVVRFGVRSD